MTIEDKLDRLIELQIINNSLLEENLQLVTAPAVGMTVGAGAHIPTVTQEEDAPVEKKKKRTRKKKEKAIEVDEVRTLGVEEVESSEPQMTLDDVTDALRSVVKNQKGARAKEVLASFNVDRLSELPESSMNDCYKAFKALDSE